MGMLKSISLENYKCFEKLKVDDTEELEIAPLTVLCGVNSSGKSSIINSLLLQKQSYEDSSISNNMKLNGAYVKSGRFKDISSKHSNDIITFITSYALSKPKKYQQGSKKQSKHDITAWKNLAKIYSRYNVNHFDISFSISLEQYDEKKYVDDNILSGQKVTIAAIYNNSEKLISTIELRKLKNQSNQYAIILDNIPDSDTGSIIEHVELRNSTCYFENFNLINAYSVDISPVGTHVSGLLASVYLILKMIALQFKNIHYLTPLRGYPKRNYILDYETDDVGLSGEFTPYIMHKYHTSLVNGFLPPENDKLKLYNRKFDFSYCVQKWMEYLHFGNYKLENALETIQLNIKDYNISNVGFGISQVLPIIVSGLIKYENELLLLEQPEIHLHPTAQMCMADFLVSMAINGKGVIVETHSDHIINRIVRRMMENDLINKKVKIYFVDQNDDGISTIENIVVDPVRGVLTDNENFFTQFASETEKIVRVGFTNKVKGQL
ncbi:MAG: AAA family ATPase [Roseburia sp.]|nr:AAA family ATPase [Roseburia sp.]